METSLKMSALRAKTNAELITMKTSAMNELQTYHFSFAASRTKDVHQARNLRRFIARILTILNMPRA